jgi:uncharacterized membrane protein YbhN (UPF0104 family)
LGITVIALYYVFSKVNFENLTEAFNRSNKPLILIALLFFTLSKFIAAYRLNNYLKSIGILLSNSYNIQLYLLGMFYNLFLPGGIGGDGYKIYLLNKTFEVRTSKIFWAIILDRVIGILALFCLVVVFFYFIPLSEPYRSFIWLLIPVSVGISFMVYKKFFKNFVSIFFKTNLQSFLVQILQIFSAYFILLSLHIQDHMIGYLFIFLISSMVAVLPLTIGGIGSREFTFMIGAQWLGLDIDHSIALSLIFYLITAFTSFWGIIYSLKPELLTNLKENSG